MIRDRWNERYHATPLLWSAEPNRFVEAELAGIEPSTGLDLACGEGRNAIWLAELGWQMVGVDFSSVAIERARRLSNQRDVAIEWITADLEEWAPGRSFGLVLIAYLHLPSSERTELTRRASEWVEPGGWLMLVGHDLATCGLSGPADPDLLWTPELARRALAPLEVTLAESRQRPLESGEVALDTVAMARQAV